MQIEWLSVVLALIVLNQLLLGDLLHRHAISLTLPPSSPSAPVWGGALPILDAHLEVETLLVQHFKDFGVLLARRSCRRSPGSSFLSDALILLVTAAIVDGLDAVFCSATLRHLGERERNRREPGGQWLSCRFGGSPSHLRATRRGLMIALLTPHFGPQ